MSDLDALLGAPLGELPAVITVDVYALALAEINDARAEIERLHQELGHARTAKAVHAKGIRDAHDEIDRLARELGYARSRATALDTLRREAGEQLNQATAELAEARAARQWIVARDSGYTCRDCGRDIRRGEAYELLDGVDEYRHVHCRRPTHHLDHVKRELDTARAEIERLTAELASARTDVDVLRRTEAREIRELREQMDDARDKYGDKLCPRCSVEVAAEAAAEKDGETP